VGREYSENGTFKRGWKIVNGALVEHSKVINPDLVLRRSLKKKYYLDNCKLVINKPEFSSVCADKLNTYKMFADMSAKTELINSYTDLREKIREWGLNEQDMVVLKKKGGSRGRSVFIDKVLKVSENIYKDWKGVLIQQFMDCSGGMPGIFKGIHEVRVTLAGGDILGAALTIPEKGSYISNINQGGKGITLDINRVPTEIFSMLDEINYKLDKYAPFIYAADFVKCKQGYRLVEINSCPGIEDLCFNHDDTKNINPKFINFLMDCLK
jgi:glutathione synthase/RimK-type ligase-like ATP-grasp enzyme